MRYILFIQLNVNAERSVIYSDQVKPSAVFVHIIIIMSVRDDELHVLLRMVP